MAKYTEGNSLGQDSTEYLVTKLLQKFRYDKGFQVQTFPPTLGRVITLPGGDNSWVAQGTLLSLPEAVYLTDEVKFRFLIPNSYLGAERPIIPALYCYSGLNEQTNIPECELVGYGDVIDVQQSGWYEEALQLGNINTLTPGSLYYFVYLYNTDGSISMLGNPGTHSDNYPYISFSTLVDMVDTPPSTLEMTTESAIHIFGSIYLN